MTTAQEEIVPPALTPSSPKRARIEGEEEKTAFVPRPVVIGGKAGDESNYDFKTFYDAICLGPKHLGDAVGFTLSTFDDKGFENAFFGTLKRTNLYVRKEKKSYMSVVITYKSAPGPDQTTLRVIHYVNLNGSPLNLPSRDQVTVLCGESFASLPPKGLMTLETGAANYPVTRFSMTVTRLNDAVYVFKPEPETVPEEPEAEKAEADKAVVEKKKPKAVKKVNKVKKARTAATAATAATE